MKIYLAMPRTSTWPSSRRKPCSSFAPQMKMCSSRVRIYSISMIHTVANPLWILAFNLVEIVFLIAPFEWWLPRETYARLNELVMGVIYSPLLIVAAWVETRQAHRIRWNRRHGEEDDDCAQEWEHMATEVNFDIDDTWKEQVVETTPDIKVDSCTYELRELKEQVRMLTETVKGLTRELADKKVGETS